MPAVPQPTSDAPPVIDVFALARSGARLEGRIALAALERLAPMLASAEGDAGWKLAFETDARGRPAATLFLRGVLELKCDICGQNLALPIESESRFWFVATEEELNAQPIEADDGEPLLGSGRFAVAQLVEDELILALPISPRHERCQAATESAGEAERQRPFTVLASLRSRH